VVLALERRGGDEPEREPDLGSEPVTVGSER
jgi:hypothetical protein